MKPIYASLILLLLIPLVGYSQDQHQADSLEQLVKKKTGAEKIRILNDLNYFYHQIDTRKAIRFGTESLELARKQSDKALLGNTLNDLSIPYITEGNYKKALQLNLEAMAIRKELKDSMGLIGTYSKIGQSYHELSQYDQATSYYTKALELARKLGIKTYVLQILGNLGNVLDQTGMYHESYKIHKDALEQAREIDDLQVQISSLGNLAAICRKLKRLKESERYYLQAIPLIRKSGQREPLAIVYQGLGVLMRDLKRHDEGLDYYKKAYAIYAEMNSKIGLGMIAVNIGNVFEYKKDLDSAAYYYELGLQHSIYTKSYKQIHNAYEGLANLAQAQGDFPAAFRYMKLVAAYKDSIQLFQQNTAISEMYAKYQTAEHERALTASQLKNTRKDKQIAQAQLRISKARERMFLLLGAVSLVLLIGGFFLRNLYLKRKKALEEIELTKKNEQLRRERELNEQKLEISRELHDNIGSQLTYMISSMDNLTYAVSENDRLVSNIRDLSSFGRTTMQELRSTIWAMNAEDGSVELLFRKLEELRSKIPVELVLRNELNSNPPLKAIEMLNLFRIGQEAIQNSLKYAQATRLSVTCKPDNESLVFEIADNGNGFDSETADDGNGLTNMRHRCEQLGGTFELHTAAGKGTTVQCRLRHLSY